MPKMLEMIEALNGELTPLVLHVHGLTLISLVKETKKHFKLYNPMVVVQGVNEDKREFAKLKPLQSTLVVESANTFVKKKECIIFMPEESFKLHYLERIQGADKTTTNNNSFPKKNKPSKEEESNSSNNVIDFVKFRKMQKNTANLQVVSANTGDGPDAA